MTDGSVIKIELYPEVAPNTVRNFISLINEKFYDGLTFHRVISGFMIQGGCPQGNGMGGPDYQIKGEFNQNGFQNDLAHSRGVISMARAMSPNSAGAQFFIMHQDAPHLMDVVDKIAAVDTDYNDRPNTEQKIATMTVDTFGETYEAPEKC